MTILVDTNTFRGPAQAVSYSKHANPIVNALVQSILTEANSYTASRTNEVASQMGGKERVRTNGID